MSKGYRVGLGQRLVNLPFRWLGARGLGAEFRYVLTVRGRVTGDQRSTPIDVMTREGRRYLVAGSREASWVKNARAAGEVELMHGGRRERLAVHEVGAVAAAPVLRQYVAMVPMMRPQFAGKPTDPDEAFVLDAARHPVFELVAHVALPVPGSARWCVRQPGYVSLGARSSSEGGSKGTAIR